MLNRVNAKRRTNALYPSSFDKEKEEMNQEKIEDITKKKKKTTKQKITIEKHKTTSMREGKEGTRTYYMMIINCLIIRVHQRDLRKWYFLILL